MSKARSEAATSQKGEAGGWMGAVGVEDIGHTEGKKG